VEVKPPRYPEVVAEFEMQSRSGVGLRTFIPEDLARGGVILRDFVPKDLARSGTSAGFLSCKLHAKCFTD
jgi:hypothetical protein